MGKKILDYWIQSGGDHNLIFAVTCVETLDGFTLPPKFDPFDDKGINSEIKSLMYRYGLPVSPETIMDHFNRELLEPEPNHAETFYQTLKHIQTLLSGHLEGNANGIEVLSAVFEAVDNQNINAAMREYEKTKP